MGHTLKRRRNEHKIRFRQAYYTGLGRTVVNEAHQDIAASQDRLASQPGVRLQGVRCREAVGFNLFRGRESLSTLDDIELAGRAGAVAAALVFQIDPMFQRRIQYRIASRRGDGKAARQKSQPNW